MEFKFTNADTGYTATIVRDITTIPLLFETAQEVLELEGDFILQTPEYRLAKDDRIKFAQLQPDNEYRHFLAVQIDPKADKNDLSVREV